MRLQPLYSIRAIRINVVKNERNERRKKPAADEIYIYPTYMYVRAYIYVFRCTRCFIVQHAYRVG
jgi:hypothetical protein